MRLRRLYGTDQIRDIPVHLQTVMDQITEHRDAPQMIVSEDVVQSIRDFESFLNDLGYSVSPTILRVMPIQVMNQLNDTITIIERSFGDDE
jgi:hypothetical protein